MRLHRKLLIDIPTDAIGRFETELFAFIDTKYPQISQTIKDTKVMSEDTEKELVNAINEFKKQFR